MFLFSIVIHTNSIIPLDKKPCLQGAFLIFFSRKFKKWNIYFGPLWKCYCGGNEHKMQSSFKTLISKDAVTWRLHQTSG